MPAYCFFNILEITDPAKMKDYRARICECVERAGGRYIVNGGACEIVEGDWRPTYPVILEFPTMADAHRWYNSEEYRPLLEMRLQATRSNGVFIEGVTPIG